MASRREGPPDATRDDGGSILGGRRPGARPRRADPRSESIIIRQNPEPSDYESAPAAPYMSMGVYTCRLQGGVDG